MELLLSLAKPPVPLFPAALCASVVAVSSGAAAPVVGAVGVGDGFENKLAHDFGPVWAGSTVGFASALPSSGLGALPRVADEAVLSSDCVDWAAVEVSGERPLSAVLGLAAFPATLGTAGIMGRAGTVARGWGLGGVGLGGVAALGATVGSAGSGLATTADETGSEGWAGPDGDPATSAGTTAGAEEVAGVSFRIGASEASAAPALRGLSGSSTCSRPPNILFRLRDFAFLVGNASLGCDSQGSWDVPVSGKKRET